MSFLDNPQEERPMSQSERIVYISQCLNEYGYINKNNICNKFEVDSRTFKRDIEYLRDRCDCDIQYNKKTNTYVTKKPVNIFSPGRYLLLYAYIIGMARSLSLLPIIADDIINKITKILDAVHLSLANAIIYQFPFSDSFDTIVLDELLQSFREKLSCRITYTKPGEDAKERIIEPLRFINYDGQWYVLAFCHLSNQLRQFSLSRIHSAHRTKESFINKSGEEELNKIVESSYGIMKTSFSESDPIWVTISFTGRSAGIVSTQEWHPRQKMESDNNTVQLTIPVESYEEILRRVLFYGPDAEVIGPEDFKEMWIEKITDMYKKFVKK